MKKTNPEKMLKSTATAEVRTRVAASRQPCPLRILMLAPQPFFRVRGTPFSVFHRIRALVRLGHTVDLVTYPFGDVVELPGLTVHRASRPIGISDVGIGPSMAKVLLDVALVAKTLRLLRDHRFDVIHAHEEAGALGAWLSRKYGIPHLYDMHSSLPEQFANFNRFNWKPIVKLFDWIEGYTLSRSAAVIAVCPALHDRLIQRGYAGPAAVIENTLDFDSPPVAESDVQALRRRLGLGHSPAVVYTGTMEFYQGLDLLVDAASLAQRRVPDARYVIVGGSSEQAEPLRRLAAERGIADRFSFIPAVPPTEVFLYHRLADVLVTCRSRGTNTPLKIYQYLRAGRPIVATSISAHTQVLDSRVAELVDPTAEAIAEGLGRVLLDTAHGAGLASAASELARTRYSETAYMDNVSDILNRMAGVERPIS